MDDNIGYAVDVEDKRWAEYIRDDARLVCPRAKEEVLTPYEVSLGVGTPKIADTVREVLHEEFKWYDYAKRQNTRDQDKPDGDALSMGDFQGCGFTVVLNVLNRVFVDNLKLLAEMLQTPERAEFTSTEAMVGLFKYNQDIADAIEAAGATYRGNDDIEAKRDTINALKADNFNADGTLITTPNLVTVKQMSTILKMVRERLLENTPLSQYAALMARQRLDKVRPERVERRYQRGQQIGTAALYQPFPLRGRVAGEATPVYALPAPPAEQEDAADVPNPLEGLDFAPTSKSLMML